MDKEIEADKRFLDIFFGLPVKKIKGEEIPDVASSYSCGQYGYCLKNDGNVLKLLNTDDNIGPTRFYVFNTTRNGELLSFTEFQNVINNTTNVNYKIHGKELIGEKDKTVIQQLTNTLTKACKKCVNVFNRNATQVIVTLVPYSGGAKRSRKRLDKYTVKELRDKAKARGIRYTGLRKDELITALRSKKSFKRLSSQT